VTVVVLVVEEEEGVSGLTPRTRLLDGLGVGSGKAGEGEADRARRLPDARELERGQEGGRREQGIGRLVNVASRLSVPYPGRLDLGLVGEE
jgi:hypothetical protein